jgi:hypothetical protein
VLPVCLSVCLCFSIPNDLTHCSHESAHTLGAVHDCTAATCAQGEPTSQCCPLSTTNCSAGGQYIMDPTAGSGVTRFSPCTIGTVCSRLGSGRVDSRCLVEAPGSTGDNGRCGNGVVEPGEACDCGNGACDAQETACCDPVTCQWRGGEQCDGSEPDSGSWVQDHLEIIIGCVVGVGGALVLLAVLGWILIRCRQRRKARSSLEKPG